MNGHYDYDDVGLTASVTVPVTVKLIIKMSGGKLKRTTRSQNRRTDEHDRVILH